VVLLAGGNGLLLIGASALVGLPVRIVQAWALVEASLGPADPVAVAPPREDTPPSATTG
jgi:hypothetical protein